MTFLCGNGKVAGLCQSYDAVTPPRMKASETAYLLGGDWILPNAPAVAEAVSELEDGENQFTLCRTPFLETCLEGQGFYGCCI